MATSAADGRTTAGCNGGRVASGRTRARARRDDECTCASRAHYRDEFHSPDRFKREDATGSFWSRGYPWHLRVRGNYDRWKPESVIPWGEFAGCRGTVQAIECQGFAAARCVRKDYDPVRIIFYAIRHLRLTEERGRSESYREFDRDERKITERRVFVFAMSSEETKRVDRKTAICRNEKLRHRGV